MCFPDIPSVFGTPAGSNNAKSVQSIYSSYWKNLTLICNSREIFYTPLLSHSALLWTEYDYATILDAFLSFDESILKFNEYGAPCSYGFSWNIQILCEKWNRNVLYHFKIGCFVSEIQAIGISRSSTSGARYLNGKERAMPRARTCTRETFFWREI